MGSKRRFVKDLLPILLEGRTDKQWYVEPFAGGMNVISEVSGLRLANDNNQYLIAMWQGLLSGEKGPSEIPKDVYDEARRCFKGGSQSMSDFMVGWIGWMASANGRFFDGGYSGASKTKMGTIRPYIKEAINNVNKQTPKMQGVVLSCCDYSFLKIPDESIIYCDIPYQGTKQYSTSKNFDHNSFWDWAFTQAVLGHKVFVSEYACPSEDWEVVWEKPAKSTLSANGVCGGVKESTEKLFTFKY